MQFLQHIIRKRRNALLAAGNGFPIGAAFHIEAKHGAGQ
jgi:hypothetical protein